MAGTGRLDEPGPVVRRTPSSWAIGWTLFAASILIMVGIFQMIAGFAALFEDNIYVSVNDWIFQLDTTTWGWVHLILGAALVLSGFGILTGNVLARTVGVIIAGLSGIAAFTWLPYYPVWGFAILALDVAVIWALTAHGRDFSEA